LGVGEDFQKEFEESGTISELGGFSKGVCRVREDLGGGKDFQKEFEELGRILELGRIFKRNLKS
jgi:uncharacterized protein (UPF0332 family)